MAWSDEMRKRAPVNLTDLGLYLLAVGVVAYAFFAIYRLCCPLCSQSQV